MARWARTALASSLVFASGACGRIAFDATSGSAAADAATDSSDACPGEFLAPSELPGLNTAGSEFGPAVTGDGLEVVFHSGRAGGMGSDDLWRATRADLASPFGPVVNVTGINTAQAEGGAAVSPDGLTLYFSSNRSGGVGQDDIWRATRVDRASPFGAPVNVAAVNSTAREYGPAISPDGLTLFVKSNRAGGLGGLDVWVATRPDTSSSFAMAVNFAQINSTADEGRASITSDGLTVFFGALGDIWVITRTSIAAPWSAATRVDLVSSASSDYDPSISPAGDRLYFTSSRPGTGNDDLWTAVRSCP